LLCVWVCAGVNAVFEMESIPSIDVRLVAVPVHVCSSLVPRAFPGLPRFVFFRVC